MRKFQPTLSRKNVEFIDAILREHDIDLIIEYGSGLSTLYFIDQIKHKKCTLTSVEVDKYWFFFNIKQIKSIFKAREASLVRKFWTRRDYNIFISNHHKPYTPIIEGSRRYDLWSRRIQYGPFVKLHPSHDSRWSFKSKTLWKVLSPFLLVTVSLLRLFPRFADEQSKFTCTIEKMTLEYHLITPRIKDQFGESPTRQKYVEAGTKELMSGKYKNILILIDGGPRHFIIDQIYLLLSKEKGVQAHICLFDAHRPEYIPVLSQKPSGKFYPGSLELLDGTKFYDSANKTHVRRMSKELWYDRVSAS